MRTTCATWLCVLTLAASSTARTQGALTVGTLDSVRSLPTECFEKGTSGARGTISRHAGLRADDMWPLSDIRADERVVVRSPAIGHVRAALRPGLITLAAHVRQCTDLRAALVAQGVNVNGGAPAVFHFSRPTTQPTAERLELTVTQGVAVAQGFRRGQLIVWALDQPLVPNGTTFAVIVDSAAQRAALAVLDGSVTINPPGGRVVNAGEAVTFGVAGAPVLPVNAPAPLLREARIHSESVWQVSKKRAWWKNPWFIAGATATAVYALWPDSPGPPSPPKSGTIRIGWPL